MTNTLSYGRKECIGAGRKFQFRSFAGRACGLRLWIMLIIMMMMMTTATGTSTPTATCQPAKLRPNTSPGRMKNAIIKYKMANHLYLAVVLPSFLARYSGRRLMIGIGYQMRIPDMLKNR